MRDSNVLFFSCSPFSHNGISFSFSLKSLLILEFLLDKVRSVQETVAKISLSVQ
ncbi:hypothetical protein OROHE_006136 [Orobanche hederae]